METYEEKRQRILTAKEIAAKANPGKIIMLKAGEGHSWKSMKAKIEAKRQPKIEKPKKVIIPNKRKLSDQTLKIGEMYKSGLTVDEIADKTGLRGWQVRPKIEVWEKYRG